MIVGKRSVTAKGFLKLLVDVGEEMDWVFRRKGIAETLTASVSRSLEEYFPSVVERVVGVLVRRGFVEKIETQDGVKIKITEKGKKKVLMFNLEDLKPKEGKWDGMWRVVFFDIEELSRNKRWWLRKYLKKLGLRQMQRSVWVSPYGVNDEVKYMREVLEIPHGVKLGLLKEVENEEDLKEWFGLK